MPRSRGIRRIALVLLAAPCLLGSGDGPPPDRAAAWAAWRPDFAERCLIPGDLPGDRDDHGLLADLSELVAFLRRDATVAEPLLATAREHGVPICLDDRFDGTYGAYDYGAELIVLGERLSVDERAVILVHELRHVDRSARGFCPSLEYDLEAAVTVHAVAEADAQAVAALYAWRTKQGGDPGPWDALLAFEHDGDIARAFETAMASGASELDATRSAFEQWFSSEWRTTTYHRSASMAHLDELDEHHRVASDVDLPADWFDGFCVLPSGEDYRCPVPVRP